MPKYHHLGLGLGENVRGTILGGVDTVLHKDSSANDAIAVKGREQMADGMTNIEQGSRTGKSTVPANWQNPGGQPTAPTTDYTRADQNPGAPVPTATTTAPPPTRGNDPYLNKVNQEANQGHHTAGTMNSGDQYNPYHNSTTVAQEIPAYDGPGNIQQHLARGDRPLEEPRHHRDDAISGDPTAIGIGQTGRGVPPQYVSAAGGPPADVGGQYGGEESLYNLNNVEKECGLPTMSSNVLKGSLGAIRKKNTAESAELKEMLIVVHR
ncbi:hypothetical protein K438DRAFT_1772328 [Mycena galopus ATCC 62051]|nr:hypothetical protein K438DRAFT_1772328 [Mycena galopus ATCC 62051]